MRMNEVRGSRVGMEISKIIEARQYIFDRPKPVIRMTWARKVEDQLAGSWLHELTGLRRGW